jgi:hypothetical protein
MKANSKNAVRSILAVLVWVIFAAVCASVLVNPSASWPNKLLMAMLSLITLTLKYYFS